MCGFKSDGTESGFTWACLMGPCFRKKSPPGKGGLWDSWTISLPQHTLIWFDQNGISTLRSKTSTSPGWCLDCARGQPLHHWLHWLHWLRYLVPPPSQPPCSVMQEVEVAATQECLTQRGKPSTAPRRTRWRPGQKECHHGIMHPSIIALKQNRKFGIGGSAIWQEHWAADGQWHRKKNEQTKDNERRESLSAVWAIGKITVSLLLRSSSWDVVAGSASSCGNSRISFRVVFDIGGMGLFPISDNKLLHPVDLPRYKL